MKKCVLYRDPFLELATTGNLLFDGVAVHTIERPWLPTLPGGQPFASCVPAGRYELISHTRPNGDKVRALVNPGLGVYYQESDRVNHIGRYLICLHSANRVHEVVGCIAPGIGATTDKSGPMVTQSRKAMKLLMNWLGDDPAEISIFDDRGEHET